jgi:predicted nucleic acid-binding protein
MSDRVFVDANVLVYAHDLDAGERHAVGARLLPELWETRGAIISTLVLQELYVNATRKIPSPLPRSTARQIVRTYAAWQTERIGAPEILLASELEEQHQLSWCGPRTSAATARREAPASLGPAGGPR